MRRLARPLAAGLLLALAVAGLAACGSDDSSGGVTAEATAGGTDGANVGQRMTRTVPAQIDPQPQTFVSANLLSPVTNAWRVGSHEDFTEVSAGALASDPGTGAFAIFRNDYVEVTQDVTIVNVAGSGPVRITRAPTGKGVEVAAQRSGKIEFAGSNDVRGTLDLASDTVTLAD